MIGIISYEAGNTKSVANAISDITDKYIVTSEADVLNKCDKIILPGVGEASTALEVLTRNGIDEIIKTSGKPVLGICLGLQLLTKYVEEGEQEALSILNTTSPKFTVELKVPQMGWNKVELMNDSLLMNGTENNSYFYYANSYYVPVVEETKAITNYGVKISAVVEKDNFFGTQFHPEKSGENGIKILRRFAEL